MKLVFLLLFCSICYAQSLDSLITSHVIKDPDAELVRLQKQKSATAITIACNYYILGRCHEYLNHEDIALDYYIKAKKAFEKLNKVKFAKDVALDAYCVISSQENYDSYGTDFLKEYYDYAVLVKSDVRKAYAYNEFAKNAADLFDTETRSNPWVLDSAFILYKKAVHYAEQSGNANAVSTIYGNTGTFLNTMHNFDLARIYLDRAKFYLKKTGNAYQLFTTCYNYGNSYFLEGNFNEALKYWLKAERMEVPYYREKSTRKLYKKIAEAYDLLNDNSNRRVYQKKFEALDITIKDREQNQKIHAIDVKYRVEEKDRQIGLLQNIKVKFYQYRIIFSVALFLVFLLALYSFIRWKKVDYSRKKLEDAKNDIEIKHTETVQELEKVKQLVIDDYIVLKNKTKVYLDKLIYIRAEDHYLYIVSSDVKSNFVRGTLAQIAAQLPPNFVKCHRSYIVNTNYIKSMNSKAIQLSTNEEILISRNFKL